MYINEFGIPLSPHVWYSLSDGEAPPSFGANQKSINHMNIQQQIVHSLQEVIVLCRHRERATNE